MRSDALLTLGFLKVHLPEPRAALVEMRSGSGCRSCSWFPVCLGVRFVVQDSIDDHTCAFDVALFPVFVVPLCVIPHALLLSSFLLCCLCCGHTALPRLVHTNPRTALVQMHSGRRVQQRFFVFL